MTLLVCSASAACCTPHVANQEGRVIANPLIPKYTLAENRTHPIRQHTLSVIGDN